MSLKTSHHNFVAQILLYCSEYSNATVASNLLHFIALTYKYGVTHCSVCMSKRSGTSFSVSCHSNAVSSVLSLGSREPWHSHFLSFFTPALISVYQAKFIFKIFHLLNTGDAPVPSSLTDPISNATCFPLSQSHQHADIGHLYPPNPPPISVSLPPHPVQSVPVTAPTQVH